MENFDDIINQTKRQMHDFLQELNLVDVKLSLNQFDKDTSTEKIEKLKLIHNQILDNLKHISKTSSLINTIKTKYDDKINFLNNLNLKGSPKKNVKISNTINLKKPKNSYQKSIKKKRRNNTISESIKLKSGEKRSETRFSSYKKNYLKEFNYIKIRKNYSNADFSKIKPKQNDKQSSPYSKGNYTLKNDSSKLNEDNVNIITIPNRANKEISLSEIENIQNEFAEIKRLLITTSNSFRNHSHNEYIFNLDKIGNNIQKFKQETDEIKTFHSETYKELYIFSKII